MPSLNNRLETTIDPAECLLSILKDYESNYPTDQLEIFRDSKRISQQSSSRGYGFYYRDLPQLAKKLDSSLANGRLDLGGLPHSRGAKPNSKIPRLFRGLWIRIFNEDGCLREDADASAVFFLRALLMCFKKLDMETSSGALFETVKDFFDAETTLPATPSFWDESTPAKREDLGHLSDLGSRGADRDLFSRISGQSRADLLLESVQRTADRLSASLGWFSPSEVVGRHGPGAVSELPSTKYKYHFARWSPNLEPLFPYDSFAVANLSLVEDSLAEYNVPLSEECSRLCAVPKTALGPRLIAVEPTSHQWIQQGISRYLIRRVHDHKILSHSIDFFDQRKSRIAALKASASGLSATVDLKSASDLLSCYVVQRLFRGNLPLLEMFRACRTRFMINPLDPHRDTHVRLRKYATMGSALTFPLQSIAFTMVALGVGSFLNPRSPLDRLCKEVRVFGDDIIVPSHWVPDLTAVLTAMRLEVSKTKTFSVGNFREACGMDAFRGEDVTPPRLEHLKRLTLNSPELAAMMDASNNFYLKGLWHTAAWLVKTVPQLYDIPVVSIFGEASGLLTVNRPQEESTNENNRYVDCAASRSCDREAPVYRNLPRRILYQSGKGTSSAKLRYNGNLQRFEIRVPVVHNAQARTPEWPDGPSHLLEFFTNKRVETNPSMGSDQHASLGKVQDVVRHGDKFSHLSLFRSKLGRLSDRPRDSGGSRTSINPRWEPLDKLLIQG